MHLILLNRKLKSEIQLHGRTNVDSFEHDGESFPRWQKKKDLGMKEKRQSEEKEGRGGGGGNLADESNQRTPLTRGALAKLCVNREKFELSELVKWREGRGNED